MNVIGKYIYGILNSNTDFRLFIPNDLLEGEKGQTNGVYTIPYQDISAIVCDSEIVDYTYMLKDALARLLVRHQKVIERIMNLEHTIIPVRLGTFAQDETETKDILNKGYRLIKQILDKISNRIEIDVAATWSDFNSVLKQAGEEKEIKEFKENLLANPKGITVDDQMRVGVMVKNYLDKKREKYALEIQTALSKLSDNFKVHELMDDKMIANFAFLIDKAKQKDFDREVGKLNTEFCERLNFRCVGSLPTYSFYTLEIKKMQFQEVDWARKRLGLKDAATKKEIKRAHQAKALSSHPDKNPNTPGIEKEFDDVTKAYKILLEYAQACEQTGQEDSCSFKEEEFKKHALLVKVRD